MQGVVVDEEEEGWRNSEAKSVLVQDFLDGKVVMDEDGKMTRRAINELYHSRPIYQRTRRDRWASRLAALRTCYKESHLRAENDSLLYQLDQLNRPQKDTDSIGRPRWNGSAAASELRDDIAAGAHLAMERKTLYELRPSYKVFEFSVFSKHVHHELRRLKRLNDPNWKKRVNAFDVDVSTTTTNH